MNTHLESALILVGALALSISCAEALHVARTIVDIADDLCIASLSDKNLDPDMKALIAGRTAQEACKDAAVARVFADQVASAQRGAKAQLKRLGKAPG